MFPSSLWETDGVRPWQYSHDGLSGRLQTCLPRPSGQVSSKLCVLSIRLLSFILLRISLLSCLISSRTCPPDGMSMRPSNLRKIGLWSFALDTIGTRSAWRCTKHYMVSLRTCRTSLSSISLISRPFRTSIKLVASSSMKCWTWYTDIVAAKMYELYDPCTVMFFYR